jgi:hypothetical protein
LTGLAEFERELIRAGTGEGRRVPWLEALSSATRAPSTPDLPMEPSQIDDTSIRREALDEGGDRINRRGAVQFLPAREKV